MESAKRQFPKNPSGFISSPPAWWIFFTRRRVWRASSCWSARASRSFFPQDQSCCGQPAYNSGYADEARAVARTQLRCFPENIPVVVPGGSCAGMVRRHYPDLFAGDANEAQAVDLAGRVF